MKIQHNFIQNKGLRILAFMNLLRKLLLPFVPLYYLGSLINKKLYDWNIKKSQAYNFPLITVGNLSVGGTGKSPMVAYIVELLYKHNKVATLSRGYRRMSKGFQLVNKKSTVLQVGDEPLQLKMNFPNLTVAVDADRKNGIAQLFANNTEIGVIVLDDAFQHRQVKAGMQILLTAYDNLYSKDMLLPTGDLREPKSAAKRASIIVVTKCPKNIKDEQKKNIINSLQPCAHQKIFFSYIDYASEVTNNEVSEKLEVFLKHKFTLVTGIASPKPLVDFLVANGARFEHKIFSDHHNFSDKEIIQLSKHKRILTTEKDFMRLYSEPSLHSKIMYLPIKSLFVENQKEFDTILIEYCQKKPRN